MTDSSSTRRLPYNNIIIRHHARQLCDTNYFDTYTISKSESSSDSELHCDFVTEQRIVQKCLAPFLNKIDFGQFFFEKQFIDAPLILCELYKEYQNCTNKYIEDCRILNIQSEHFFAQICSSNFQKQLSEHQACFNNFQDYFVYSSECFHNSMFQSNQEITLFRSEYEHDDIKDRKCGFVQWYLNCSITDAYNKACSVAAEIIRKYYELLLNSNQNSCDLQKLNPNLSELNLTSSKSITQSSENSSKINKFPLEDLINSTSKNNSNRCDIASERYVVEAATELRKYEYLEYQLFRIPFHQLMKRTPCLTYKIYKKNIQDISPQCRNMNIHLEKIYDYYCSENFANILINEESCIEKLHSIYNESDCSDAAHFLEGYNPLPKREISDPLYERCEFARRYIGCGINESFYEACPQVARIIQNYFDILINANNSNCHLRQRAINSNETFSDDSSDYFGHHLLTDCAQGFLYDKQLEKCIDVDECASNKHLCSQKCVNKPGSYECQCFGPLYKLTRNGRHCYRTDSEPVLLFLAHSHSIWNITYNANSHLKLIHSDGIEKEGKLYYVDLTRNSLQYVNLFYENKVHVMQNHDIEGTEGISVDWIHRNLYSLRQKQLHVQRLDGLYRTLLYEGFFQLPRALVAYPLTRELFASDWSTKPFIVRLAMDGTQAKKIVTENLVWPNALAIDYFAERLYWADAFRDVIEMANLDGTGRRTIISDNRLVAHVFGLTVFDDMIFWSDWSNRGLLFADKLTGRNSTMLMETEVPAYSVKAYHSAMQMAAPNLCETATCQHICVPKLDGSASHCLCAEGFIMHKNGFCEPNCKKHEFVCSQPDHKCLNLIYRCDGLYNCGNGDDEIECPIPLCMHDERKFPCRDSRKCIFRSQLCDGFADCYDHSDELYCTDVVMEH